MYVYMYVCMYVCIKQMNVAAICKAAGKSLPCQLLIMIATLVLPLMSTCLKCDYTIWLILSSHADGTAMKQLRHTIACGLHCSTQQTLPHDQVFRP